MLTFSIFNLVGTSCGYSVPFFDYQGERLVLDNFFEKWQDGSDIRKDGVPSKLVTYWNKKNGLSIDSMPGLKLADDLSTALVPPFKLHSIAQGEEKGGESVGNGFQQEEVDKKYLQITSTALVALLACSFALGIIVNHAYQSGYYLGKV